jgi:hypothetical protein
VWLAPARSDLLLAFSIATFPLCHHIMSDIRFNLSDLLGSLLRLDPRRNSGSSFGTSCVISIGSLDDAQILSSYPHSLSFSEDDTSTISSPDTTASYSPSSSPSRAFSFRFSRRSFSARKLSRTSEVRPRITKSSTDSVFSLASTLPTQVEDCLGTLRAVEVKHAKELKEALETNEELHALVAEQQAALASARNDMAILVDPDKTEGTDPSLVLCELKALNSSLYGLCASVVALYPPATHTSIPTLPANDPLYEILAPLMDHPDAQYMPHRALLLSCLQTVVVATLNYKIFARFHPGLRTANNEVLTIIYAGMVVRGALRWPPHADGAERRRQRRSWSAVAGVVRAIERSTPPSPSPTISPRSSSPASPGISSSSAISSAPRPHASTTPASVPSSSTPSPGTPVSSVMSSASIGVPSSATSTARRRWRRRPLV